MAWIAARHLEVETSPRSRRATGWAVLRKGEACGAGNLGLVLALRPDMTEAVAEIVFAAAPDDLGTLDAIIGWTSRIQATDMLAAIQ